MAYHMTPLKCHCCNSLRLDKGFLQATTGSVYLRLDDAKFFTLKTGNVETDAYICSDCGAVSFYADLEKVHALEGK